MAEHPTPLRVRPDPLTMHVRGETPAQRALRVALVRAEQTLLPEDVAALHAALRTQRAVAQRWRISTAGYALALGGLTLLLAYVWPERAWAALLLGPAVLALLYGATLLIYAFVSWER